MVEVKFLRFIKSRLYKIWENFPKKLYLHKKTSFLVKFVGNWIATYKK